MAIIIQVGWTCIILYLVSLEGFMIKMIYRKALNFVSAVLLGTFLFTSGMAANAADFTPEQKNEIIQIFQEFFLDNPEIIREALVALEQKNDEKRAEEIKDIIKSQKRIIENPKGLFIAGNPDADVTLIEFFDYNCVPCKGALGDILFLLENDKNLKIVFYETPIIEQSSLTAAHAALAAKKQNKYLAMHASMLSHTGVLDEATIFSIAKKIGLDLKKLRKDMASPEVLDTINNSFRIAELLGVQGTPAFIIGDELYRGYSGLENMRARINEVRINK